MNDRELLELAAKAAEVEVTAVVSEGIPYRFGGKYWNPLTDDGDALRLAVKLDLGESIKNGYQHVDSDADIYAATRRAIVRAAAEIGRAM